jgi:hypothetical protein
MYFSGARATVCLMTPSYSTYTQPAVIEGMCRKADARTDMHIIRRTEKKEKRREKTDTDAADADTYA